MTVSVVTRIGLLALSWWCASSGMAVAAGAAVPGPATESARAGERLFAQQCAGCHEGGVPRAPNRSLLELLPPTAIEAALTRGAMQEQGRALTAEQRGQVAEFLTGRALGSDVPHPLLRCHATAGWFDYARAPAGRGWGIDAANTRLVPAEAAGLSVRDVPKLKLAWAFAYPNAIRAAAQPLVAGGGLFVGSQDGTVYALDARTGCVRWTFQGSGEIRGTMVISPWMRGQKPAVSPTLYFGDNFANVYALDATTGALRWKQRVDEHSAARVYGTPVLFTYKGVARLYVPVASFEEVAASTADYPCCTFRGSIAALDPATGRELWRAWTVQQPATQQGTTSLGKPRFGPSGAGVWNSPTIDERRGLMYFGTGNNYSAPPEGSSNAIIAIDLGTGAERWRRQALAGDASNMSCYAPTPGTRFSLGNDVNCPANFGPDLDFTVPPILVHVDTNRDVLVAGQKSGTAYGIDPDTGRILWTTRLSRGDDKSAGGMFFGLAAEAGRVFVPMLDFPMTYFDPKAADRLAGMPSPDGLFALDARDGRVSWSALASDYCRDAPCPGNQAAVLAIPGVVFSGSADGRMRAFDSRNGKILWDYDTTQRVTTVNGDAAHGGGLSGSGLMVAEGHVYVNSGYGGISGAPGNVLLAFKVRRGRE